MLIVYFSLHPNQNIQLGNHCIHTHKHTWTEPIYLDLSNCVFLWMRFSLYSILNAASLSRVCVFLLLTNQWYVHTRDICASASACAWVCICISNVELKSMPTLVNMNAYNKGVFFFSVKFIEFLGWKNKTKRKYNNNDDDNDDFNSQPPNWSDVQLCKRVRMCVCVDKLNCWIRRSFVQNVNVTSNILCVLQFTNWHQTLRLKWERRERRKNEHLMWMYATNFDKNLEASNTQKKEWI